MPTEYSFDITLEISPDQLFQTLRHLPAEEKTAHRGMAGKVSGSRKTGGEKSVFYGFENRGEVL